MAGDTKEVNYLELSDDELMNLPEPPLEPVQEASEEEEEIEDPKQETADEDDDQEASGEQEEAADDAEEDEEGSEEGDAEKPAKAAADEAAKPEAGETPKSDEGEKKDAAKDETPAINYEQEYKRLLAPFKANGREIVPKSVDDAIALMQMGANYNKKMAALKPNLRLMKMLENNQLLDEEKLSFLIDLEKRKPEAISKLVKDSGLDPMDLDAEKASGYQKTSYAVDEREIELDQVLEDLKESPAYNRTLEIVGSKWDLPSKQVIAQQPELLKVINSHIERGIFDLISKEVENERAFGRLSGLSDIEAYRHVGDAIQARGGFNHLMSSQGKSPDTEKRVVEPKSRQVDEERIRQKRRAASPTKPSAPKTADPDFNPLALSDEEFSKMVNKQYL